MNTSIAATGEHVDEIAYRSPRRCLIRAFRMSRDRWKKKALQRNAAVKVLKVRVSDLERSRQQYREQAQQARLELAQAQQQIELLQVELRQREETRQALEKKSRRFQV